MRTSSFPGVDTDGLKRALEPHGRVEDLVVADRLVGVRLHPRDKDDPKAGAGRDRVRAAAQGGEHRPGPARLRDRRRRVALGRGRHAPPRLHGQRDGAAARDGRARRSARTASRPRARVLRTVSPTSFAEDPLRLVRALRFVSQLGFEPDESTLRQMRDEAPAVKLVSGERIGGGLAADGMGELSKLLLGREPAKALRLARDTGVLVELLPEFGPAIGFDQESRYHALTVDEHTFAVVQAAADAG